MCSCYVSWTVFHLFVKKSRLSVTVCNTTPSGHRVQHHRRCGPHPCRGEWAGTPRNRLFLPGCLDSNKVLKEILHAPKIVGGLYTHKFGHGTYAYVTKRKPQPFRTLLCGWLQAHVPFEVRAVLANDVGLTASFFWFGVRCLAPSIRRSTRRPASSTRT